MSSFIPHTIAVLGAYFLSAAASAGEYAELAGHWQGTAQRGGDSLRITLDFAEDATGLTGQLGLPEVGSVGQPLEHAAKKRAALTLVFGSGKGRTAFDLRLKKDTLKGTVDWRQFGFAGPVELMRVPDERPYTQEEITFFNRDIKLTGTVFVPDSPGPHPGIVIMHGSGDNERWWRRFHADLFARNGLACVIFDKRGNGGSSGHWRAASFEDIARDGLSAIDYLRDRDDIDPDRVGFWGISQAGWIMPLAASLSDNVAFIITVSGATVTVEEEGYYDYVVRLKDLGFAEEDIAEARSLLELDYEVTRGKADIGDLLARVKEVRDSRWYKPLGFAVAPADYPDRAFMKRIIDFNPVPVLKTVDTPTLWLYGDADKSVDAARSIGILRNIMDTSEKDYTIRLFPGADHGLRVAPVPDAAFPFRLHAPGYYEAMIEWLDARVLKKS